jgi:hypothetical protein
MVLLLIALIAAKHEKARRTPAGFSALNFGNEKAGFSPSQTVTRMQVRAAMDSWRFCCTVLTVRGSMPKETR